MVGLIDKMQVFPLFLPGVRGSFPWKGPIATFYCDVPKEKVIFKGEQMHVRI